MSTSSVNRIELSEIGNDQANEKGEALVERDLSLIRDVNVSLNARVGTASLSVDKLFSLKEGEVVELAEAVDQPIVLELDGKPVARGHLVAVEDRFGIRITDVL